MSFFFSYSKTLLNFEKFSIRSSEFGTMTSDIVRLLWQMKHSLNSLRSSIYVKFLRFPLKILLHFHGMPAMLTDKCPCWCENTKYRGMRTCFFSFFFFKKSAKPWASQQLHLMAKMMACSLTHRYWQRDSKDGSTGSFC